jgi:hypothetical protein
MRILMKYFGMPVKRMGMLEVMCKEDEVTDNEDGDRDTDWYIESAMLFVLIVCN